MSTRMMNPRPFKAYFFPGGGSGIWTLAVLAKSSKLCGRRWFVLIHLTIARFKNWRVVREVELVVVVDCEIGIGAGVGAASAETVGLAGGGAACGAAPADLLDLPQPAATMRANANNTSAILRHRPSRSNSSKNGFIARVDFPKT